MKKTITAEKGPKKPKKPVKPKKPTIGSELQFRDSSPWNNTILKNRAVATVKKVVMPGKILEKISLDDYPELFLGENAPLGLDIDLSASTISLIVKDENYKSNLISYKNKMAKYIDDETQYKKQLLEYEHHQAQTRMENASKELAKLNREIASHEKNLEVKKEIARENEEIKKATEEEITWSFE